MTRPDEALMDRGGMASSALRVFVNPTNLFALALAFLFGSVAPAPAQTVVGGVQPPSVTVDQSVLDSLGPPQTLPDLLRGAPPERRATAPTYSRERSAQHQVKAKKKKVVAKAKPKHKPPAVAAHRAAPVAPVAATAPAVPRESVAATPLAEPKAAPSPPAAGAPPAAAAAAPNATAAAAPNDTAAAAPSATAAIPPAPPAETATEAASPGPAAAPPPSPPPSVAKAAPAPVKPATPTVAPPSPVPSASPSSAAQTAMAAAPSLPPAPPVAATPVAAPAAVAAAAAGPMRVLFAAGAADLPDAAKPKLDALVQRLSSNDEARVQLVAHASGSDDQANEARRISLQRALAVRSYLIEHGIASTRMDVRALGNRSDGAAGDPLDRVDVIMLER